ncbi:MAG: hypothetical protein COV76_03760 [Candidatus Omnitrophica bacterium CG11_big_fil_rev_8_21_14_0_20_64_10]|nr:MAG: hypothetical protein COV76_03760 [Candidatus Omnitrophica bacterium CG11_big_fil_rev_8_21_14_0_20_64_10]
MATGRSRRTGGLAAVILAAGDGTRMRSRIPKVLHTLCGKPLIGHVLAAVRGAGVRKVVAVLGYRSELVRKQFNGSVAVAVQRELKGTGHAVQQALPELKGFRGDLVVLYGDTPLLTAETVRGLIRAHRRSGAAATLLTAEVERPTGYGRIVRDRSGRLLRIVEEADASPRQRGIREINVGAYCFDARALAGAMERIRPAANGEYYLTDAIDFLVRGRRRLATAPTRAVGEFMGINTRADLARVRGIMRRRTRSRRGGARRKK